MSCGIGPTSATCTSVASITALAALRFWKRSRFERGEVALDCILGRVNLRLHLAELIIVGRGGILGRLLDRALQEFTVPEHTGK